MEITIGSSACRFIKEYVGRQYPAEACGILLGDGKRNTITAAKELDNILDKDKGRHFFTDPIKLYRAEKETEKEGLNIIGFFHSHPDVSAVLSGEDEEYMIPGLLYVIIPVTRREVFNFRGYIKNSPDEKAYEIKVGIKEEEKQ